jgi:hypothetical protein
MSTFQHLCCVPGCEEPLDTRAALMCRAHWLRLPKQFKSGVYRRLRGWKNGRAHAREFIASSKAAIAAVKGEVN